MCTRAYPQTLCMPTRPWSADASTGQVRPLPPVIANRLDRWGRLSQTADAPAQTRPESPAATSTLPVGHHPSGRVSNRPSCIQVSDHPTWMPATPGYCNYQHTSRSRSSCDQPRQSNWRVVNSINLWSLIQVQERLLHRPGIVRWSHGFESHKDNRQVCHPTLQRKAGKRASSLKPGERGHRLDNPE